MHFKEFKTQVEAQGVKLPTGWGGRGGNKDAYIKFAGLGLPGSGTRRNFTIHDVRLAVAWIKVHALTGTADTKTSNMGQKAAQMLAYYTTGWIIMSQGQVYWTDRPTKQVFDKGAICIPALK